MKRFILCPVAFVMLVWLGCDKAQNPISLQNSSANGEEADLKETLADSAQEQSAVSAKQNNANQIAAAAIRVPDDYSTIQAAVDAANPGDKIIVKASGSPYNEHIVKVNKTGLRLTAAGSVTLNGHIFVWANNVEIDHFNINVVTPSSGGGIEVQHPSGGTLSGVKIRHNTITGNPIQSRGIWMSGAMGCLVTKNTCTGHLLEGIGLSNANGNVISQNNFTGNGLGIGLGASDNNEVSFNDCSASTYRGIDVGGDSDGNNVKKNVCNRNGDSGIAVSSSSDDNTIGPGNTANFNSQYGIILFPAVSNNTVIKNDFHCNTLGDIFNLAGTDNKFIENSTGPLPECL